MPSDPVVEALGRMLERDRRRYEDTEAAQTHFRNSNAAEIAAYEATLCAERRGERVLHVKRGSTYKVVSRDATIQTETPLHDMASVVIYRSEKDGSYWVRSKLEFDDGRFVAAPPVPAKESEPRRHNWVKSQLGHGDTMCSVCSITNREAAVLGRSGECEGPYVPAKESE